MAKERADRVRVKVGRRIAALRRERELTQEGLAERLRIASRIVSRMEAGQQNLTIGTMVRIANALGVSVADLFA